MHLISARWERLLPDLYLPDLEIAPLKNTVISQPGFSSTGTAQPLAFGLRASARLICSTSAETNADSAAGKTAVSLCCTTRLPEGRGGGGEACLEKPFFASKLCLKPLLPPGQILRSYTPTPVTCTSLVKFPPTSSGGEREVAFPNQLITILSAKQKEL